MRSPQRIDSIIDTIATIWKLQPDTRWNQLVSNLQREYHKRTNDGIKRDVYEYDDNTHSMEMWGSYVDLWNVEDEPFYLFLVKYLEEMKTK